jgi:hypothetical protein
LPAYPILLSLIEANWIQESGDQLLTAWEEFANFKWRFGTDSPDQPKPIERFVEWNGYFLLAGAVHYSDQLSETPPTFSLRKEVIQPQVLLRLPCYDFTPIMNHTLGRCLPCGSARRLLVQSTFVM